MQNPPTTQRWAKSNTMNYICGCGYQWTSRKQFGAPGRCPRCSSTSICPAISHSPPSGVIRRVQLPSEAYDSNGNIIFQKSEMQPPYPPLNGEKHWQYKKEEITDPEKIEEMKKIRERIRDRIRNQNP